MAGVIMWRSLCFCSGLQVQHPTGCCKDNKAFDIPHSTINDFVHKVADKIIGLQNRVITFPLPDELPGIGAGFERLAGSAAFSTVVGSTDGCHIRFKPPSSDAQCYLNRKFFFFFQFKCRLYMYKCNFLDIFVGYPASVHNARVLKNMQCPSIHNTSISCTHLRATVFWGWWISLYIPTHHPHNTSQGASEKSCCSTVQQTPCKVPVSDREGLWHHEDQVASHIF
ncbi:hypothetical protein LDENG_00188940 [Lucifuga dentata]|nr:hypothetical protein LDENG_00188940 [Lucifuga dentata]